MGDLLYTLEHENETIRFRYSRYYPRESSVYDGPLIQKKVGRVWSVVILHTSC